MTNSQVINGQFLLGQDTDYGVVISKRLVDADMVAIIFKGSKKEIYFQAYGGNLVEL